MVKNVPHVPGGSAENAQINRTTTDLDRALSRLAISSSGTATPPSTVDGDGRDGGAKLTHEKTPEAKKPDAHGAETAGSKVASKADRCARVLGFFDETYGGMGLLEALQLLCEHIGVEPGLSITACRKAIKKININIVDFVAAQNGGPDFKRFGTPMELRRYIMQSKKVLPLAKAKKSPVLKCMLVEVHGLKTGR
ncbi:hypothetical protein LTR53_013023 [Teratosphaeriaceae sp. CCFEE 6253]|nr:hypothetical protein LTR53_013023 [Teratosphaeriaceae sp. CCFEE 6253]